MVKALFYYKVANKSDWEKKFVIINFEAFKTIIYTISIFELLFKIVLINFWLLISFIYLIIGKVLTIE